MKTFYLVHQEARSRAARFCIEAPDGWRVVFAEPKRKEVQSDKFHAMIGDIARQTTYAGQRWDAEDMKRILVDEFAEEMRSQGRPLHHDGRLIPSENGRRVIQLGIQSRELWVREASDFIEFLYAWGNDRGVQWSESAASSA
jgi:hypothetical protein